MQWTRILDTKLGEAAWGILGDSQCDYHNGYHVAKMYDYLHKTNEPYNEELDWAVLFHDIVYDDKPGKEIRSSQLFNTMSQKYPGINFDVVSTLNVATIIHATIDHLVHEHSSSGERAIIRADLHALTNPVQVMYNYLSIMEESMWLYKIDEKTFAENSIRFMEDLYERVSQNETVDIDHKVFYSQVKQGIKSTIALSRIVKGDIL
jgi:predicted metal-dependent HD superfamily phosphohydrolase